MPKLHLKRTPDEEAARQLRKKQKKAAKAKRKYPYDGDPVAGPSSHKRHQPDVNTNEDSQQKWASSDEEAYGPQPDTHVNSDSHSSYKPDYEAIRAELEEKRFREKMFGAFEDDERLDSLEARLNDFAHVPGRWRSSGGDGRGGAVYDDSANGDNIRNLDPRYMDEEEYTEWIRAGMYRKTHAEEYAEQQRKKAQSAARRAEEKARKAETARLEKIAEEERKRKKLEREIRRWDYAREEYDLRWKDFVNGGDGEPSTPVDRSFKFEDIPWPVLAGYRRYDTKRGSKATSGPVLVSLDDLTPEAVSGFLLPRNGSSAPLTDKEKKDRKEKLREMFLRYHPDKFEGRFMKHVDESEKEKVKEGIGLVVRVLNTLMVDVA